MTAMEKVCIQAVFLSLVMPCKTWNQFPVPCVCGIELISFLEAGTVLCFELSLRRMLITHRCFSCCPAVLTLSQGIFRFPCSGMLTCSARALLSEQGHKKLGGAELGQLTQTGRRDILYHGISCHPNL